MVRFVAKWLGSLDPHGSVQTVTICDGTSLDSQDAELPGPLLPVLSDLAPGYTDYTDKADYTAEHDSQTTNLSLQWNGYRILQKHCYRVYRVSGELLCWRLRLNRWSRP